MWPRTWANASGNWSFGVGAILGGILRAELRALSIDSRLCANASRKLANVSADRRYLTAARHAPLENSRNAAPKRHNISPVFRARSSNAGLRSRLLCLLLLLPICSSCGDNRPRRRAALSENPGVALKTSSRGQTNKTDLNTPVHPGSKHQHL